MRKIIATEITSKQVHCGIGACPALFRTNRNTVFVVGSTPAGGDIPKNVLKKIGRGEMVVEIPQKALPK